MSNRIAEARNEKGLTLVELAKLIGVSDGTVSRYETGKREPKLDIWQKLSDALDVSVSYLQGVSDDPTPESQEANYKAAITEELWWGYLMGWARDSLSRFAKERGADLTGVIKARQQLHDTHTTPLDGVTNFRDPNTAPSDQYPDEFASFSVAVQPLVALLAPNLHLHEFTTPDIRESKATAFMRDYLNSASFWVRHSLDDSAYPEASKVQDAFKRCQANFIETAMWVIEVDSPEASERYQLALDELQSAIADVDEFVKRVRKFDSDRGQSD